MYHRKTSVGSAQFLTSMDFIIICQMFKLMLVHHNTHYFRIGPILNLTDLTIFYGRTQEEFL